MVQTVIVLTKVRFENLLITWISAKGERCIVACTHAPHEKTKYVLQRSLQSCNRYSLLWTKKLICAIFVPLQPNGLKRDQILTPTDVMFYTHLSVCVFENTVCTNYWYIFWKIPKAAHPFWNYTWHDSPWLICFLGHALQQNPDPKQLCKFATRLQGYFHGDQVGFSNKNEVGKGSFGGAPLNPK